MPAAFAAATSSTLELPVSTVTMTEAPAAPADSTAARDRPWPSSRRDGTYGIASTPRRRRASVRIASPVIPSASKSPNTRTRSPRSRASEIRAWNSAASGSRRGSWREPAGSPRKRRRSSSSVTPRAARSATTRGPRPSSCPASSSDEETATGFGKTQRLRGASTSSGCHAALHRGFPVARQAVARRDLPGEASRPRRRSSYPATRPGAARR